MAIDFKKLYNTMSEADSIESGLGDLLKNSTREDYDGYASVLKSLNQFDANYPNLASFTQIDDVVQYFDKQALSFGSYSPSASRSDLQIDRIMENQDVRPEGNYSGRSNYDSEMQNQMGEGPNMLKIYLGLEENTFPESEYSPTSWTRDGEALKVPEQGWRSIKEHSSLTLSGDDTLQSTDDFNVEVQDDDLLEQMYSDYEDNVKVLMDSVEDGTYDPSKHAFKLEEGSPLSYDPGFDLGHFTKSIGYDAESEAYYFSASEVWDFDPEQYETIWAPTSGWVSHDASYGQAALMNAAGEPIGIYDRHYLPDSFMEKWAGTYKEDTAEDIIINNMMDTNIFNKEDE